MYRNFFRHFARKIVTAKNLSGTLVTEKPIKNRTCDQWNQIHQTNYIVDYYLTLTATKVPQAISVVERSAKVCVVSRQAPSSISFASLHRDITSLKKCIYLEVWNCVRRIFGKNSLRKQQRLIMNTLRSKMFQTYRARARKQLERGLGHSTSNI